MAEVNQQQVIDYIKGISVMELSQLVKALEAELAGLEALLSPSFGRIADRRGPLPLVRVGLVSAAIASVLLPLPNHAWAVAALAVIAGPTVGTLWLPGMTSLSHGADAAGLDQGLGFALMNLAWASSVVTGAAAGGPRSGRSACATPGASASTARRAISGSATSARATSRRSTSSGAAPAAC